MCKLEKVEALERIDFPYLDLVLGGVAVLLVLGLMWCFVLLDRELTKKEDAE